MSMSSEEKKNPSANSKCLRSCFSRNKKRERLDKSAYSFFFNNTYNIVRLYNEFIYVCIKKRSRDNIRQYVIKSI